MIVFRNQLRCGPSVTRERTTIFSMRTTCLIHLGLLILAASMGARADEPAVPSGFGETDGALPDFVAIYDVDNDGRISNEERQALTLERDRNLRFRDRWDADKDGVISDSERETAKESIRLVIEKQRRRRFAHVDTDDDGFLSREEFAVIPAVQESDAGTPGLSDRIFEHMDQSPKDGRVSEREFLSALEFPEVPKNRESDSVDTTSTDGTISPESR